MSFSGLAPPPPFLPAQGRPPVPWPQRLRMFETFLLASGASDFMPERRKALLLHSLGIEGQRIFFTLPPHASETAPSGSTATETDEVKKLAAAPSSYEQAVAALTQHFASASNVVVECHRFCRRTQQPCESIQEYVAALWELASSCSFVATDDSLRDQFIEGNSSENLRERLLLEESSLSFSPAVLLAQQLEQAAQQVRELVPRAHSAANFARRSVSERFNAAALVFPGPLSFPEHFSGSNNASAYCYHCGSHQHRASSSSCPAQGQRCFHCDRIGHFRSVCNKRQRHSTASVHEVNCQDLCSGAEGLSVLTVAGPARAGIFVDVFIAGKPLKFLVDSGSSVSILEESIFKQHFANESLLSTPRLKLLDYSKPAFP
ncbi:hypothetical protein MTO96_006304 [Rhipicephalus appendiculatus]